MKWSLNELRYTADKPLEFSEDLDLKKSLQARNPEILDVAPVHVDGLFTVDELGTMLYAKVKTTVTLPSTRSFKPVPLDLAFDFTEHYLSRFDRDKLKETADSDIALVLDDDIIDLNTVIVDNILLQIPMQVLAADEQAADATLPTGKDWNLLTEDQVAEKQKDNTDIDPRFAKLKGFFDEKLND